MGRWKIINVSVFRIKNCREECRLEKDYCSSFSLPSTSDQSNFTTILNAVESEITLNEFSKPNLCFHREDKSYCHDFEYSSFFQIKSGLEATLRNGSGDETYQDCCTFAINAYSNEATFFSNLTCNPATNCHVICGVEEVVRHNFKNKLINWFLCISFLNNFFINLSTKFYDNI